MYVNVHTHMRGEGVYVLDTSGGEKRERGELCSLGIHPLFAEKGVTLEQIRKKAEKGEIVAVGEAGFDRNAPLAMEEQSKLFEEEVKIAEEYELPVIIHCVRAFPELLSVYKKMRPRQAWIVHGYDNNEEILAQLLRNGFSISAGKKLFVPRSNIRRVLPSIPPEQLFLETDDADRPIESVYREAAGIMGVEPAVLMRQVYENFKRAFHRSV